MRNQKRPAGLHAKCLVGLQVSGVLASPWAVLNLTVVLQVDLCQL
jgi:hypothetical protein